MRPRAVPPVVSLCLITVATFAPAARADEPPPPTRAEFDALTERLAGLEAREAAREQAELDSPMDESHTAPLVDLYGFFDLSLYRRFIDSKNVLDGVQGEDLSFAMSHVNLYLASQLSPSLSALVELGFSFLPMSAETYTLDTTGFGFERQESKYADPMTTEERHLGGVTVERAQLTYQPRDVLGVTAGRFLTPFGIWNVDHGSPVLLTAVPPFFMVRGTMPLAQTGLYVHGRLIPRSGTFCDYGLTVANGRGPTEAILDLNDHKALGLSLKLSHDGEKVRWSVGGYGYWGKTTDTTKTFTMPTTAGGLPRFSDVAVARYTELVGSVAFLLEVSGLRVQLEYVRGLLLFDRRPLRQIPLLEYDMPNTLQPDYARFDAYLLLGYTLPLETAVRVTPYLMAEHSTPDDSQEDYTVYLLRAGLNVSPHEAVYLKLEGMRVAPFDSMYLTPVWGVAAQLAVAF